MSLRLLSDLSASGQAANVSSSPRTLVARMF